MHSRQTIPEGHDAKPSFSVVALFWFVLGMVARVTHYMRGKIKSGRG
jgi:hypothetical protein